MDRKYKGITWVGNIYQTLEAFCEEVDSLVSQDKGKYERNQIQADHDNVRTSDSSVTGEYSNPEPLLDGSPDINHEESCDKLIQKSIPNSLEVTINNNPEKAGVNNEIVSDVTACIAVCSVAQPCESLPPDVLDNVVENGMLCSGCDISTDVIGTVCTYKSHETIPLVESSGDGHKQHSKPVSEASLPAPEIGPMERLNNFDWQEAFTIEQSTVTIEEFEDVKLDDDCWDSELIKDEICFIYHQASKKKSYKKKLTDAFASKLRPTKKLDYEQVAIWYADAETKQRAGELSTSSTANDSYESDWELL